MGYLIVIAQLLTSLSILVVLHEAGHFFFARLFGTRVEKFYLFFDWGFSLFKYKAGDTEYGIGWLPLGGYVKISGMIDESMDLEQMKQPPQEWEFRSKTTWQRLLIMLGGVIVNFILGFFIWGMLLFTWGEQYLPVKNVQYGIYADSLGQELGLRDGDNVLAVDNRTLEKFGDRLVVREIVINNAENIRVDRDGNKVDLPVPDGFASKLASYENKGRPLYMARIPFVADSIPKGTPAYEAGIKKGDRIIALNGEPTDYFTDFVLKIRNLKNTAVKVTVDRGGVNQDFNLTTTENATIGVFRASEDYFFDYAKQEYGFGEAMQQGVVRGYGFLRDQVKAFGQMFRGKIKASESLGGFGSIASLFPSTWNWQIFWRNTAILSLILGFMNLLPIPALDGGHVMFLLYEMVTGRRPSDKFLEYATIGGFVVVLFLMVYANGLDILRWWRGH